MKRSSSSPPVRDRALVWTLRFVAAFTGGLVGLIVLFLVFESGSLITRVGTGAFLHHLEWQPSEGRYGMLPMLLGTLAASVGALLVAVPLGVGSALFCRFYAPPRVARVYIRLIEVLAGVPSVVYGLWGLTVLVPLIARLHPPGPSLLAASLILALMILPTIALLADAALANVPPHYLTSAAGLGLSRWATIRSVALPAARSGLFTAVILGTGRAIGETMAVLMVAGNVVRLPSSFFVPIRTLTANIALEMGYALDGHREALFVGGLMLMMMVMALVGVAEVISRGRIYD